MPVHCPIEIPRLTSDQFAAIDYCVMGAAFALHNDIGCKWNEATYQFEFAQRLKKVKTAAIRELPISVTFGQFSKTYQIDLLVSEGWRLRVENRQCDQQLTHRPSTQLFASAERNTRKDCQLPTIFR